MPPNADEIKLRSYLIWENEGRPHGRDTGHWLQAEAELATEVPKASTARKSAATKPKSKKAPKASTPTKRKPKLN